jgi:hypothetical protein
MFAVAAGVAYATIPDSAGVFTACMLNRVGTIRLVDPSLPSSNSMSHCTSLETQISFDQQGHQGLQGLQGSPGPQGPAGTAGKDGAPGTDGLKGADGSNGSNGKDGANGAACLSSDPACVGPKGDKGEPGTTGTPGTNGLPGAKGDPGTGFTWRGGYLERTPYHPGDVVSFAGSAWITNEDIGGGDIAPPTDPWQLLAAKGADGAAGLSGYQIVTDTVVVKSDQSLTTKTISCPAGKMVLGGGAPDADGLALYGSGPVLPAQNGGLYGWMIGARFAGEPFAGQTDTFTGYAICAVVG